MLRKIFQVSYMTAKGIVVGLPTGYAVYKSCRDCFLKQGFTGYCYDMCPVIGSVIGTGLVTSYLGPLMLTPAVIGSVYGTTRTVYRVVTAPTTLTGSVADTVLAPVEMLLFGHTMPVISDSNNLLTFKFSE